MVKQSWVTTLFIKHVLGVQRTPFYLRNGYAESPRLKPLGDTVIATWRALRYAPIAAILLALLLLTRLDPHQPDGFGKCMCIGMCAVFIAIYPLDLADTIRRQIMIDGN